MNSQSRAARKGVTLRHWTADRLFFVGGGEKASPESSRSELADSRLLRLVASRLSDLKAQPIALTA